MKPRYRDDHDVERRTGLQIPLHEPTAGNSFELHPVLPKSFDDPAPSLCCVADVLMHRYRFDPSLMEQTRGAFLSQNLTSLIRQVLWESIELRCSYVLDGVSSFSNTIYLPYLTIYLSFQAQLGPNAAMVAVKVCGIDRGNFMICRAAENNYLITLFIDTCNEFQTNQFSYPRYLSCILDPHD